MRRMYIAFTLKVITLHLKGAEGVKQVLTILRDELLLAMKLSGRSTHVLYAVCIGVVIW